MDGWHYPPKADYENNKWSSYFDPSDLREELLEWEQVYNTVRPHQALGYVTPLKFLQQQKNYKRKEVMCH